MRPTEHSIDPEDTEQETLEEAQEAYDEITRDHTIFTRIAEFLEELTQDSLKEVFDIIQEFSSSHMLRPKVKALLLVLLFSLCTLVATGSLDGTPRTPLEAWQISVMNGEQFLLSDYEETQLMIESLTRDLTEVFEEQFFDIEDVLHTSSNGIEIASITQEFPLYGIPFDPMLHSPLENPSMKVIIQNATVDDTGKKMYTVTIEIRASFSSSQQAQGYSTYGAVFGADVPKRTFAVSDLSDGILNQMNALLVVYSRYYKMSHSSTFQLPIPKPKNIVYSQLSP